jgi:diadenylate cyclase
MSEPAATSLDIRRRFAPGTRLREAVDLVIRQGTGALVVVGNGPTVEAACSGGFFLAEAEFTAQRLAELAKMDGGIVIDDHATRIVRANVHFNPNPTIETRETGTRFRTAERLARQTRRPVISVSEEGRSVAIVYTADERYELRRPTDLLAQANQTMTSTERMRRRLDDAVERLSRLEVDDIVTVGDVAMLLLRAALVHRLSAQVDRLVVELGGEAQLIAMQAADLIEGVDELAGLVYADYVKRKGTASRRSSVFDRLEGMATMDLYDAGRVATALGLDGLDTAAQPRGIRALAGVPRFPESVKDALVSHFRTLQKMLYASVDELDQVEGVGTARAVQLRSYLDRIHQAGTIGM